ncbi:putative calcium/proton exchanger [Helianthus debilis subsp. tardiflorus]
MTAFIALLSEYLVDTIEAASTSWGMPLSFISIILLPIVGNGAKHARAIIFSLKNMLVLLDQWKENSEAKMAHIEQDKSPTERFMLAVASNI